MSNLCLKYTPALFWEITNICIFGFFVLFCFVLGGLICLLCIAVQRYFFSLIKLTLVLSKSFLNRKRNDYILLKLFLRIPIMFIYQGKNWGWHNLCGLKEINPLSLLLLDCFHFSLIFSTVSLTINQKNPNPKQNKT